MGNYNPNAPQLLGQQWVPIRNADTVFSPQALTQELGHGFTLSATRQINNLRYYSHDVKANAFFQQAAVASIYPRGAEALSGPIQQVIIPVVGGSTAGAGINVVTTGPGPGGIAQALRDPSDGNANYVQFTATANSQLNMQFDIQRYPELQGKRIMNVRLIYSGFMTDQDSTASAIPFVNPDPQSSFIGVNVGGNSYSRVPGGNTASLVLNTQLQGGVSIIQGGTEIDEIDLGDVCLLGKSIFGSTPLDTFPWTYGDVFRFDPSAASPVTTQFDVTIPAGTPNALCYINYVALKVTYCEETRVAYGVRVFQPYYGMNRIIVGTPHTKATNPILPAGDYTMTLAYANPGDVNFDFGTGTETVDFNACTQLYPISSHPGVAVSIPFPLDDHLGDQFSSSSLQILTQLSLHATGGVLTEPHVYGRQIAAQIYGNNVAQQTIYDDIVGVATPYQQVRYYARHWGGTTVPLLLSSSSATISGTSNQVSITPRDFDLLPEIVDGWREVTLRFPSAPSMGAISPDPVWQWSATGELAGSRWEILGACAPAVSGFGANLFAQVPPNDRLGAATYQPPVGAAAGLSWIPQGCSSPFVTGASLDPAVDAVLIFSQDPPIPAGFTLTAKSQAITGIGLNCGSLPCCIPSGLSYNQLTWTPQTTLDTGSTVDSFQRIVASGLGSTDTGMPYDSLIGTWAVDGDGATDSIAATSTASQALLGDGMRDMDQTIAVTLPVVALTQAINFRLIGRRVDANNMWRGKFAFDTTGQVDVAVNKIVGGVSSFPAGTISNVTPYGPGSTVYLRMQIVGDTVRLKAWTGGRNAQPLAWTQEYTEAVAGITRGRAGFLPDIDAGNTNTLPLVMRLTDYSLTTPGGFGSYELQRWDPLATDFQTIMLSTSPYLATFNDYEARVGQQSVYRIRVKNLYNFAGPFSSQVTGSVPAPGVSGGCADMTGALIFTANAAQQGNANAAYLMQWESDTPEETFTLPEAGDVIFQQFYNRDGSVAFHGTERGLETFQRLLLLQGGAISLPSMANGKTIRDLAWSNYPYICVRDDLGNRWFATVQIPNINVRNNRQAYMATAIITETTQIPFAVNP